MTTMNAVTTSMLLQDQLALITGAGSGIGAAITRSLAQAGARVLLCDRDGAACEAVAATLREGGYSAEAHTLDVTDQEAVLRLAAQVGERHGDLHILVNNAGVLVRRGLDDADARRIMRKVMDVNLHAAFELVLAFLPALRRSRGNVVNTASGAAFVAQAGCVGYSASKAALSMLTKTLAVDLGADGVRVNAVAPGVIETPMTDATRADPARLAGFLRRTPAGRVGQPEEVAAAVLFLASPLASYINGVTLPVDGGFLAT